MGKSTINTTICCNDSTKNHFKILREQKGWNQAELSDQFKNIGYNISQQVISKYESKAPKTSPQYTKEILSAYCTLFKTSADYLLGFTEYQGKDYKNLRDISQKTGLSPQSIKALRNYDSGFLRILDNLICTEHKEYPDYTGTLELLLKTLWDYSYRMKTENIELKTTNTKPQIITDHLTKRELFKPIPLKIFDSCLDIAEQSQKEGD